MTDLDRYIKLHKLLWEDGGGVISRNNLFECQELVDGYLLLMAEQGKIAVQQNIDGRIIHITKRVA
jgi:hypothetical protein